MAELVDHKGGCHCGKVAFEVQAPRNLVVWNCNCSICNMARNTHFIVPQSRFKLLQGEDALTEYTFNTGQAKHLFCKHCGIKSFYRPRSNPDGVAVTIHCLDKANMEVRNFDGQNWEEYLGKSGISECSKA